MNREAVDEALALLHEAMGDVAVSGDRLASGMRILHRALLLLRAALTT